MPVAPGGYALDDLVFQRRVQELIQEHSIKVVVETGVNEGKSTVLFAKMAPVVVAIDKDVECLQSCCNNIKEAGLSNVAYFIGDSPMVLKNLMPLLPDETLYFLDAHWEEYWPLLDEIRTIRKGTGIIVLHDVVVPNHPELGYDTYHGYALNYGYVRPILNEWSPTHRVEYNSETEGTETPRGIMYVFPK